jgi:uncharacterized protein (TIGR03067 family)
MFVPVFLALTLSNPAVFAPSDLDRLQGTWEIVSAVRNGEALKLHDQRLVYSGNEVTIYYEGRVTFKAKVKLDETSTPRTEDLSFDKRATYHYIYKIEGDKLTTSKGPSTGLERPKAFRSMPGEKTWLDVWKRREK